MRGGAGGAMGAGGDATPPRAQPATTTSDATRKRNIGAQATTAPFDASICPIDWRTLLYAPSGDPPVSACVYCGRDNEPNAQFCMDCGKPLGKVAAMKAAASSPASTPAAMPAGGPVGGSGLPGTRVLEANPATGQ